MRTMTMLLIFCFASTLSAHVALDHAVPAVGSTVRKPPTELKLWFDGPVGVDKSKVEVTDENARSIVSDKLRADPKDITALIVPITPTRGKITVKWEAYCPDCDHTTSGTFSFTINP